MQNPEQSFALNLRRLRKKLELTQTELGGLIGYTEKSVSKWESGASVPPAETLFKLADILGCDIYSLFGLKESGPVFIGIDGGGTATDFAIADSSGNILRRIRRGPSNPFDIGMEATLRLLEDGIDSLLGSTDRKRVTLFAGLSGGSSGDAAVRLNGFFSSLGLRSFGCGSDLENAVETALGGRDGAAVIAGTGSSVCAVRGGRRIRIGGYGPMFDLSLSGYVLGTGAVRAALAECDGSGCRTELTDAVIKKAGGRPLEKLEEFYSRGKVYAASFAPLVFDACRNGDKTALKIVSDSVEALARQASAALAYAGPEGNRLVLVGGLTANEDVLRPFIAARPELEGTDVEFCRDDPVNGAVRLALKTGQN